jgi:hypothetical protein
LFKEEQKLKSEKAFRELTELLTAEDLKNIAESSREFREKFVFEPTECLESLHKTQKTKPVL